MFLLTIYMHFYFQDVILSYLNVKVKEILSRRKKHLSRYFKVDNFMVKNRKPIRKLYQNRVICFTYGANTETIQLFYEIKLQQLLKVIMLGTNEHHDHSYIIFKVRKHFKN